MTNTPDRKYCDRTDNSLRLSWSENLNSAHDFDNVQYINYEHKDIFDKTKNIPGWQMEGDTYKLFEMGYCAGDVILEIGTYGGRSAVVEICGARGKFKTPQLFGIDIDMNSIDLTYKTLKQFRLTDHALLFKGSLDQFMNDFSIRPTMCFLDGDHRYEGVKRDLLLLSKVLSTGVPILCHDYTNPENDTGEYGVRQAVSEWEKNGFATFFGVFGCAALFVTTDKCTGTGSALSPEQFSERRKELLHAYGLEARTIREFVASSDYKKFVYSANANMPKWLGTFSTEAGFPLISQLSRYGHDETKYDEQYKTGMADISVGSGLVSLLRELHADFSGPAIEIGCGTGVLSVGLVNNEVYPQVIVTDPSPVFLTITFNKMKSENIDTAHVHFAVLKAEEIDRLPANEFSLIALRSTLHHVLDVEKFIRDAAQALRPGGSLVFQEPCVEGYVLMGAIAQFIPLAFRQAGVEISEDHAGRVQLFIDTMRFYARRDLDKIGAEDKHLFRVDEIMETCASAGLSSRFFPNMTFEQYSQPFNQREKNHSFYTFFYNYLKYCMSFDQPLMDLIAEHFRSYCMRIEDMAHTNIPYMHGVFMCRKQ